MELKDFICDKKYAIRLKKLGVDQTKSYAVFYGCQSAVPTPFKDANQDSCGTIFNRKDKDSQKCFIATFTVDELLEILPKEIKHKHNDFSSYYLCMGYDGEKSFPMAWYEDSDLFGVDEILISEADAKLSNALAKVLIWLIKHKYINFVTEPAQKKVKKCQRQIPIEKVVYNKMLKRIYSFKYKSWFTKTKVVIESDSMKGNWYSCKLINDTTDEVLEEFFGVSHSDLSNRFLSFINNPNFF